MTTSLDNRSDSEPRPDGYHWNELRHKLSHSFGELESWGEEMLIVLEERQAHFVTKKSLGKSLRQAG